ncbi:MAG: hypothetical protein HGB35_00830 [Geobacteraceae bacterium]|nr:hypothetical protein [Geobacteraceae bacterium]
MKPNRTDTDTLGYLPPMITFLDNPIRLILIEKTIKAVEKSTPENPSKQ